MQHQVLALSIGVIEPMRDFIGTTMAAGTEAVTIQSANTDAGGEDGRGQHTDW